MKKRTMNELRQTKEFYVAKQKVLSDGGFDTDEEMKQIAACVKEIEQVTPNPAEITLEDQIQEIAAIVAPTMYDVIFNEIIEVMDNYDDLNWGYFVQDDAPTALLDACFDHKTELHYEIFQVVLQKLK